MGGSRSSSKRKSSKRKRDKISSKKKKKISRKESKKSRRDYDSGSSYSDDESINSDHTSSSASEFTHRRKLSRNKKRHRDRSVSSSSDSSDSNSLSTYDSSHNKRGKARKSRIELKSTKRRSRKRSSSPDKDVYKLRKRKKLGRDGVGKPRRKSSKKKSRKRISSSSGSDSESCSTCSGGTAGGKRKRSKVFSDEENEKLRAKRKHKARSPSCSSYDRGGSHESLNVDLDEGKLSPVNNPRRLKSVITVVYPPHDEGEDTSEKDPNKEEIVYDQDDYPSSKSFDSNEAVELDNQSHHATSKGISQDVDENDHQSKEAHTDNKEIDDLESILRQKALENLMKFRGGIQTGPKGSNRETNNENDENQLSDERIVDGRMKPTNQSIPQDSDHIEKECAMDQSAGSHADLAKKVSRNDTSLEAEATKACSSSAAEPASSMGPTTEERNLEGENEAKDGSQFENKTMSVMRGGEMVQVSYKVYIPKKVPALARRQLKR